jgi:Transglutaminase-like superfamily
MEPFALLARRGCSPPCSLALALAAEFAPIRPGRADLALDGLAARLAAARDGTPGDQLAAVADLAWAHLEPVTLTTAIDDLLVDRVAADGAGHPLLLAILCAEAARRAGLRVGIVAGPDGAFLAHAELTEPLLVDPTTGVQRETTTLSAPVQWQCCHQVAARILNRIGERAEHLGHVVWSLRAAELRLVLPFDRDTREQLRIDMCRVRARLN